jgi:plastocyanin
MPDFLIRDNKRGFERGFVGGRALLLAAALLSAGYGPNAFAEPKTHTVVIEAMQFSPQVLEVSPGDTVVWVNKDAFPHNATATNRSFQSKDIAQNGSWKFKADKKGTFPYICTLHPTMKASLVVK